MGWHDKSERVKGWEAGKMGGWEGERENDGRWTKEDGGRRSEVSNCR